MLPNRSCKSDRKQQRDEPAHFTKRQKTESKLKLINHLYESSSTPIDIENELAGAFAGF